MDNFLQDLRYGARRLIHSPGFTAIVVITLALGIGANTAIFSVVNAVLLRPLPYRDPEQLVTIEHFYPSLNAMEAPVSAGGFRDYRDNSRSFSSVAVQSGFPANLTGHGDPERLNGQRVSALYFKTMGVTAALGRTLLPDADQPGRNHEVVIGDGLWHRLFGASPRAVGDKLILNGEPYEIVGVMPRGYRDFFARTAEIWTPLALTEQQFAAGRTNEFLNLSARLKPAVTVEQARAEMTEFARRLKKETPDTYARDWTLKVVSLDQKATGKIRPALLVLLGAVGFVLLIACANVANLLLARGAARLKEIAIRSALGAKRAQLVRQLLTESMLLALSGAVLGLALAYAGVKALVRLNPSNLPGADQITIDATVVLFTLALAMATGLLFGLAPALQTSATNLQETLREGGRGNSGDRGGQATRRALVVAEIALALVLLTGAGLLIRSFSRIEGVDPGFATKNLLTFNLRLPGAKYASDTQQVAAFDAVLPRIASIPGVTSVGATSVLPFSGDWSTGSFEIEGLPTPKGQSSPWGDIRIVSSGFAKALGIPLVRGRFFSEHDDLASPSVAVADEVFVKRYFPTSDPIGKRVTFGGTATDTTTRWITIVGVVGHAMHEGLDAEPRLQLYLPYMQRGAQGLAVAVRTTGDPARALPDVRKAIHSIDADLPLSQVKTMEELLDASVGQRKLSMLLLALFSGLALLLASIGIYGVMSYSVTQRSREIGVRMALGADPRDVLRLVLRQGMTLALVGVAIGLVGALVVTRLIASQLYDVKPTDPATFILVALLLSAIAAVATLLPALRATRVAPTEALQAA